MVGAYLLTSPLIVLLAVSGASLLLVLLLVPTRTLPAIAFISFVLFSGSYVPLPTGNGAWSAPLFVMVVFAARSLHHHRALSTRPGALLALVTLLWIVAATVLSVRRSSSVAWTLNFAFLVMVPAVLLPDWPEARDLLRRTWIVCTAVLGAYAVIEFVLSENILYGPLYRLADSPLTQSWDVYRVTTTLGHPLVNGTFFAVGCLLAGGAVLRSEGWLAWAGVLFGGAATFLTASRGAILALAVGISIVVALLVLLRGSVSRPAAVALAVVVMVVGTVGGSLLADRAESREAAGSTAVRVATFEAGEQLAREYLPLGAGPGLADNLKRELIVGDPKRGIESSWLQLLISIGIPGVVLIGATIIGAAASSARDHPEVTGALAGYAVAIATYNLIESNRPALLLLGALLGLVGSDSSRKTQYGSIMNDAHRVLIGHESRRRQSMMLRARSAAARSGQGAV